MKFLVKMMVPENIVIDADGKYDADKQARRLRDALDDKDGNHTITLLTVEPVEEGTQNGAEDTQGSLEKILASRGPPGSRLDP